jgi:hypothetical protein
MNVDGRDEKTFERNVLCSDFLAVWAEDRHGLTVATAVLI